MRATRCAVAMRAACWTGLLAGLLVAAAQVRAETPLIWADRPVTVGLRLSDGEWQAELTLREAATVTLACPGAPGFVRFDGLTAPVAIQFDERRRTLQLRLPAGHFTVTVRARGHARAATRAE
jgi:hypothetical protein